MALSYSSVLWAIAALSWLGAAFLAVRLWRSADFLAIKIGLTVVLAVPVLGPLFFFWVQAFPAENHPALKEDISHSDTTWRKRLEHTGMLPPLVQHWRRKRK